jgi:hypothetical protein
MNKLETYMQIETHGDALDEIDEINRHLRIWANPVEKHALNIYIYKIGHTEKLIHIFTTQICMS